MKALWDYDEKEVKRSKVGKLLLMERLINYGVYLGDKEKIDLKTVKKNWNKLNLEETRRKLLRFLIWKKLS